MRPDGSGFQRRYDQYCDSSGSWTFDIAECKVDLELLIPGSTSSDPTPEETYQTAVCLERFIETQQRTSNWSDEVRDWFESTLELEAVATPLREIAKDTGS